MKIVIPGGSGHVGQLLARSFLSSDEEVVVLTRGNYTGVGRGVRWDGKTLGDWAREIDGANVVVNLAGRSVDCRYNAENRRQIMDSRVDSTRAVGQAIAKATNPPATWLQMSTATIYAHTLGPAHDEASHNFCGTEPDVPDTWNFSIEVANNWEAAATQADTPGTRLVLLRSAMVMQPDDGSVFRVLSRLVRLGLGGSVGGGRQFVSWMHGEDFARAIRHLVDTPTLSGPMNLASPEPLPYRDFMATLRRAWGMPIGLPATKWMLEIGAFVLRTESELVLKSRRVVSSKLPESGFKFEHPAWAEAAADLVRQVRGR